MPVPTDDDLTSAALAVSREREAARGPLTATERALLGHVPSFRAYQGLLVVRDELAPIIGERALTLFSYAISSASGAGAAASDLRERLVASGEDPDAPQVTETEQLLIDWGRVIGSAPHAVPAELSVRIERAFGPRTRIVLVAYAGLLVASNLVTSVGGITE